MKKVSMGFVQPKRRLTRQKSGYNVGGVKTGSECKILPTRRLNIKTQRFQFIKQINNVSFTNLFGENIGIFGAGGYFKVSRDSKVTIRIEISRKNRLIKAVDKKEVCVKNVWHRIGSDIQVETNDHQQTYKVGVKFSFDTKRSPFELEFYKMYAGVVEYYAEKPKYKKIYFEKTNLYKPDIYYLEPTSFNFNRTLIKEQRQGFIICKSCNRCARFLPIDINREANPLGFSNHCKKKAPCTHNAFCRYLIENQKNIKLIPQKNQKFIINYNGSKYVQTYYGFQLECRSCKKFVVNAPLNPLRNKAQHHEDSARRRAFERLIIDLTGKDVVKNFRINNDIEFQTYVWNRFSKKCFGCGKKLIKITDMDIDHTLPLAYLWPLDTSATALCKTCNSQKHDLFPREFRLYDKTKLKELSKLTGIPLKILTSKERMLNKNVAKLLVKKVEWFFDSFLSRKDYQKYKKGKLVADLVYKALNKVLTTVNIDLVMIYKKKTGRLPTTITLE
jgi:5-methylcytosine-specific restriction endonuclease McrA